MNSTYLLLGSNMGNSQELLQAAIKNVGEQIGAVTRRSAVYKTAAWGDPNQPDFLNQVIISIYCNDECFKAGKNSCV